MYGRNLGAREAVFEFLRVIDLRPLEWDEVASQTGSGSPFVFEVLARAFDVAQAVVVILTPDEEVALRPMFHTEPGDARTRFQPRPNVLFEAGMAFMRDRNRTILLDFGPTVELSDLHGVHTLRVSPGVGAELRQRLVERLRAAGCPVSVQGTDWLSAGNFDAAFLSATEGDRPGGTATGNTPAGTRHTDASPTEVLATGTSTSKTALASGSRSVAVGGNASGSITTGDQRH